MTSDEIAAIHLMRSFSRPGLKAARRRANPYYFLKSYEEEVGKIAGVGGFFRRSEDLVHVEKIEIGHAVLTALETRNRVRIAHSLDGVKRIDLLDLISRNFLDVAFVSGATEIVDRIAAQISQEHGPLQLEGFHGMGFSIKIYDKNLSGATPFRPCETSGDSFEKSRPHTASHKNHPE